MKVAMHSRVLLLFILVTSLPYLSSAQQQDIANPEDDFSGQDYQQALVIENTSYQNTRDSPPSLTTPNQVSNVLQSLGFQVIALGNAKQRKQSVSSAIRSGTMKELVFSITLAMWCNLRMRTTCYQ